jgi:isopenicillin-N N-acyltransferase like protein
VRGTGSANTLIVLEGGARDRGERHGRLLADEIHARLESLAESRRAPGVRERLELLQRNARAALPELVAEVEGIAKGARVPVEDIFSLNAFEALNTPFGCTAVAVPRVRGGAVVAQNWDAPPDEAPFLRILLHLEPDGTQTVMFASAGGLGWAGISSTGVALLSTDLTCRAGPLAGVPSQFLRRFLLRQPDTEAGTRILRSQQFPGGRTYVLGDASGRAVIVEIAPGQPAAVRELGVPDVRTNHAEVAAVAASEDVDELERVYPYSRQRHERAVRLLTEFDDGGHVHGRIRDLLTDHDGAPMSICRHPGGAEASVTLATLVLAPGEGVGSFALGGACGGEFVDIHVPVPEHDPSAAGERHG